MKTLIQISRQLILVGLISFLTTSQSVGQVITRVLSPDDQFEKYIPWYNPNDKIPIVRTPLVDVEAILEEDSRTGREMPRIGIKQEVAFSTEDGLLTQNGNYSLWSMALYSESAKSISIRFDETHLPDHAIMFLYNEETRFIVGPIKQNDFRNGTYRSDYINGDHVKLIIFFPSDGLENDLALSINTFDHGIILFRVFDDDFEGSEDCNVNVACEEGNGWECQSESVCKIIHSSIGSCTGSLINNDCCDLTPFILTADHCVAGLPVDDYLYRFNYQSPQCNPNGETPPSQWITYFGSQIRANWGGTDFGLVELLDDPSSGMSFAGWDRTNQTPSNTTFIHHPSGDVKKITFDNGTSTPTGNFYNFNLTPGMNGDFGTLEGGSSGCPKYNSDQRIIGQQSGGSPHRILCTTTNSDNDDGRFDISWEGNGTNATRLRNWLGASTNPNTMDCMDHPYITGPDALCTQPRTFTLINNMPCIKNVQWEVSPSYLLASPSSGSGNSANLWAKPNVKGNATITFTLTSNGCDPIELEKDFWIGEPNFDLFYNGPSQPCLGDVVTVFARPIPNDQDLQIINWQVSGCGQISSTAPGINAVVIEAINCVGWMRVCATAKNECGTKQVCRNIYIKKCNGTEDGPINPRSISDDENSEKIEINVFPNPSNDYINVSCDNCDIDSNMKVSVLSPDGSIMQFNSFDNNTSKIDMTQMLSGLYILKVDIVGEIYYKKIIKI
ncbi:MAG: T9SS type A sorting domain-containing protein [Saprospiraceae bacterium]